jgi:hypothetical protein
VYCASDDALLTEYIPGENAGHVKALPEPFRARAAEEITESLVAWHGARRPEGFGELNAQTFAKDFRDIYYPVAAALRGKAHVL